MAEITGYTASRMKAIEDAAYVSAALVANGDDLELVLTRFDGGTSNLGNVKGDTGAPGVDTTTFNNTVAALQADIDTNTTNIGLNDTDIADIYTKIGSVGGTSLQTQVTNNDSDISDIYTKIGSVGGTSLQTQVTNNDSDISDIYTKIGSVGGTNLQAQVTTNYNNITNLDNEFTAHTTDFVSGANPKILGTNVYLTASNEVKRNSTSPSQFWEIESDYASMMSTSTVSVANGASVSLPATEVSCTHTHVNSHFVFLTYQADVQITAGEGMLQVLLERRYNNSGSWLEVTGVPTILAVGNVLVNGQWSSGRIGTYTASLALESGQIATSTSYRLKAKSISGTAAWAIHGHTGITALWML